MTPAEAVAATVKPKRRPKHVCTIRERRTSLGLTLRHVTEATGINLGHLSGIEHGQGLPSLPYAFALARFFGCTVEELWPNHATITVGGNANAV